MVIQQFIFSASVKVFFLSLYSVLLSSVVHGQVMAETLLPWQEGFLDIHHISTGRGNATYVVFPDGTTLLIDAGDISDTHPRTMSARNSVRKPNSSKSAPEWIIDYIQTFAPVGQPAILDYAVVTHYHDDHFGEWDETRGRSAKGGYQLTGIMAVGDQIPIHTLLDRGSDFPVNLKSSEFRERARDDEYHILQTLEEYWKFIDWHQRNSGLRHEVLKPGSDNQITLETSPTEFPDFSVRNIAVNGVIWTGYAEEDVFSLFAAGQYPGENPLSTCLRISYGEFDYFTGGDISGINHLGETDFNSLESHIAPVVGAVDIATLNHHGNRDSQNAYYVRTLRPRVWIGQTWSSDHPGHEVLRRITSQSLYPGPRDVFATDMLEANELVIGESVNTSYRGRRGHIVVRVQSGGNLYDVYVLNDAAATRELIGHYGPYQSR